jgi:A-factor type gamma-butyrolactone 1'-reductase (1S-forming)
LFNANSSSRRKKLRCNEKKKGKKKMLQKSVIVFVLCALCLVSSSAAAVADVDLSGKVVLITGASSGIGAAAARRWASQGAKVVLTARRLERLHALAEEIREAGGQAAVARCDVTVEQDQRDAFKAALEAFGEPVQFVFANAGYEGAAGPIADVELSEVSKVIDINLVGYLITMRESIRHWRENDASEPAIAFVSSIGGSVPRDMLAIAPGSMIGLYSATKSAVNMVVRSYAATEGLRVLGIGPGLYSSEMVDRAVDERKFTDVVDTEEKAAMFNPIFPGRVGNPVHIADAAGHFFAGTSAWQSGDNIIVDNEVSYSSHWHYVRIEQPGGWLVPRDQVRDISGNERFFSDEQVAEWRLANNIDIGNDDDDDDDDDDENIVSDSNTNNDKDEL